MRDTMGKRGLGCPDGVRCLRKPNMLGTSRLHPDYISFFALMNRAKSFFFEIIHGPGNMGEIIINSLRGEKVNTRN
jgi:hypothetical protein